MATLSKGSCTAVGARLFMGGAWDDLDFQVRVGGDAIS